MGIFVFFMMPAHQIWSCHVTQEANFEKFLFFPNSAFNIRKSYEISSRKAIFFRSYQPKTSRGEGVETPPPNAFRVNDRKEPCFDSENENKSTPLTVYLSLRAWLNYNAMFYQTFICFCLNEANHDSWLLNDVECETFNLFVTQISRNLIVISFQ